MTTEDTVLAAYEAKCSEKNQRINELGEEVVALRHLVRQLSEIESMVNRLSPPNFKGNGEPVTLTEKVQWLIDRYNRADRYAKASPAKLIKS